MSDIVQLVLATTRGIITQTFASGTSSWTAPAGVTKILTASGRGDLTFELSIKIK